MSLPCLLSSFGSSGHTVWEEMSCEKLQDGSHGGHLGFSNSETLCHSDASHQVSAQSNLLFWRRCCLKNFKMATMAMTYGVREVVWRISRWQLWQPSWISERKDFSISEIPCSHNASHQVSAQSDIWIWRRCHKCEKLTMDASWRTKDGRWTTDHSISWPGAKL